MSLCGQTGILGRIHTTKRRTVALCCIFSGARKTHSQSRPIFGEVIVTVY